MSVPLQVKQAKDRADEITAQNTQPEEPTQQPAEQPAAPVETVSLAEYEELKERYSGLRSSRDTRAAELEAQIASLHGEMATMQEQLTKAQATQPQTKDPSEYLSEDERDVLGDEALNVIAKLTQRMAQDTVTNAVQPVAGQVQSLSQERAQDKEMARKREAAKANTAFVERLKGIVPNVTEIDNDPKFGQWLDGYDEMSGRRRRDIAMNAKQAGDVQRLAQFYQEWAQGSRDPRESMTSPTPSNASPTPNTSPQGKIWTRQEVSETYKALSLGKVKDPQEAQRLRSEILAAQREGRIR